MTDQLSDYQKKLTHMVRYIEQEAHEKAEEIDTKTDEEFIILKEQFLQEAQLLIAEEYDKKKNMFLNAEKLKLSSISLQYKLQIAEAKMSHMKSFKEEIRVRILNDLKCTSKLSRILFLLILEGLYKLMEPRVIIQCRKQDINTIKSIIQSLEATYTETIHKDISLKIDNKFLDDSCLGGVILLTSSNTIILNNMLDTRLDQIIEFCVPAINTILYDLPKRIHK